MTVLFKKATPFIRSVQPGTWLIIGNIKKEEAVVSICCPKCWRNCTVRKSPGISKDAGHSIDNGGKVHPSVVCPNSECNFHSYIILESWESEKFPF